jgi:hypothetical protein
MSSDKFKYFLGKTKFRTALRRPGGIADPYWARCGITLGFGLPWEIYHTFENLGSGILFTKLVSIFWDQNKNFDIVPLTYA